MLIFLYKEEEEDTGKPSGNTTRRQGDKTVICKQRRKTSEKINTDHISFSNFKPPRTVKK
jgi:hypothetical protein